MRDDLLGMISGEPADGMKLEAGWQRVAREYRRRGYLDVIVLHHPADSIGAFAVVGMGAVFAGIIRAPMTSILIIFEMTGGYGLVLPLMIANMSAYALARHWRHQQIYEALLEQDGIVLDRDGEQDRNKDRSGSPAQEADEIGADARL